MQPLERHEQQLVAPLIAAGLAEHPDQRDRIDRLRGLDREALVAVIADPSVTVKVEPTDVSDDDYANLIVTIPSVGPLNVLVPTSELRSALANKAA